MPKIEPVAASSKINMLVHSDIGWGKTSFIGSGGKQFKILIMRPPTDHVDAIVGSGCQQMVVRNWEDVWDGLEQVIHMPGEFDIFAMDSISLLQDIGLDDVYEGVLDKKGPPGSAARQAREQFGPDKGEYRVNMWRIAQWVRRAVSAEQFHLIITAHSFLYEPENQDAYIAPWIQGKGMISKISGMMNIVGYGHMEEATVRGNKTIRRVIEWNKTEDYYAKNQFKIPSTGESVFPTGRSINPTLPQVFGEIAKGRPVVPGTRRPGGRTPTAGRKTGTARRPSRRS